MGFHFHEWIDNKGIVFSVELLLQEVTRFEDFGGKLENFDK